MYQKNTFLYCEYKLSIITYFLFYSFLHSIYLVLSRVFCYKIYPLLLIQKMDHITSIHFFSKKDYSKCYMFFFEILLQTHQCNEPKCPAKLMCSGNLIALRVNFITNSRLNQLMMLYVDCCVNSSIIQEYTRPNKEQNQPESNFQTCRKNNFISHEFFLIN